MVGDMVALYKLHVFIVDNQIEEFDRTLLNPTPNALRDALPH
jgi:hypothetical protein